MSFVGRGLAFQFISQSGQTFPNGSSLITIPSGNMASVRVTQAGMPGMGGCEAIIWGLTLDIMNQICTLGIQVTLQPKNLMVVTAVDDTGANPSEAFRGGIYIAYPDMNQQPETPLRVTAYAGAEIATLQMTPLSFTGGTDLIIALQALCDQVKYTLETNGVSGIQLSSSYLWGSPRDAVESLRQELINRGVTIDIPRSGTVAVWYTQKARSGPVPTISTGTATANGTLIGYPTYTQFGIDFKCIYNPNLKRGGQVQVQSSLPSATGLWGIYGLSHALDAQIPNGKWESGVQATRQGYPTPVVTQGAG
jgi:hypothetical protein